MQDKDKQQQKHFPQQPQLISGLDVYLDFVTAAEEKFLITQLDAGHWAGRGIEPNPEMKRRHQHFGGVFSYRLRKVVGHQTPLPGFLDTVTDRLLQNAIYLKTPNSAIVNEYEIGQGIMPHVDAPKLFGTTITALSLLSDCVMTFQHVKEPDNIVRVLLPRRSLVVMNGSSRYDYKHGISKDEIEHLGDLAIHRGRRVSITYRDMVYGDSDTSQQSNSGTRSSCNSCVHSPAPEVSLSEY